MINNQEHNRLLDLVIEIIRKNNLSQHFANIYFESVKRTAPYSKFLIIKFFTTAKILNIDNLEKDLERLNSFFEIDIDNNYSKMIIEFNQSQMEEVFECEERSKNLKQSFTTVVKFNL